MATMKSDLRNLETAEEGYASSNAGAYLFTGSAVGPDSIPALHYSPSAGVTITLAGTAAGWSAKATHASDPGKECAIFVNTTSNATYATQEGVPACN